MLCAVLLVACQEPVKKDAPKFKPPVPQDTIASTTPAASAPEVADSFIGYFVDSLKIGRKGFNKLEMWCGEETLRVCFFSKRKKGWILKNELNLERPSQALYDCLVVDVNGDGYRDVTYTSATAARGGNVIKQLLTYEPSADTLTWVKNSEDYPNLIYDPEHRWLNSFALTGSSFTTFLRLQKDSLQRIAEVSLDDSIYVEVVGKSGEVNTKSFPNKEQVIYARLKTFRPLRFYAWKELHRYEEKFQVE